MAQRKYVSLSKLSTFLDNLNRTFASLIHKHTISDISDFKVDSELSPISTNPVQNKVLDAEFEAISVALNVYDAALDDKADASHKHLISDITNLQSSLDEINEKIETGTNIFVQPNTPNAPNGSLWIDTDEEGSGTDGGTGGGTTDLTNQIATNIDTLEFVMSMGYVNPVIADSNKVFTDNNNNVYVL